MWLTAKVKDWFKPRDPSLLPVSAAPVGVHQTPAGSYPADVPSPSKVAVLLYYVSCVFCVIGTILVVRSFFLKNVSYKL